MKKISLSLVMLTALVATSTLTTGCFTLDASGSTYSRDEVRQGNKIYYATIVGINNVTIEGTSGGIGSIGGAILGGVLGSGVGGGTGRDIATAVGGIGGALVGSKAEENLTRTPALEITIQYVHNGELEAIVQTAGQDNFYVGQEVSVLVNSRGVKRVRP